MIIFKRDVITLWVDKKVNPNPEPILWFRQGLFCIIPIEIVKNAYDQLDMNAKLSKKTNPPIVAITWTQGIPVDPKVGYALLGEQSSN